MNKRDETIMDIQNHPIGVLDSGLGGISVLRELVRLMPEEDYLYFGDATMIWLQ